MILGSLNQSPERTVNRSKHRYASRILSSLTHEFVDISELYGRKNAAKQIILRRLGGREMPLTYSDKSLVHPLRLTSALADIYNIREVFYSNAYALPHDLTKRLNGKPVLDIGAFIGVTAAYFASHQPDSPVLALEPMRRNFDLLTTNAEPYEGQIQSVHGALGTKPGRAHVIAHPDRHKYMPLYSGDGGIQETLECTTPVITPERLTDFDEIGIIKMDIEGAEHELFASGAMRSLLARTSMLMIETHDQFIPGCSQLVAESAAASGLIGLANMHPHTAVFTREF